MKTNLLRQIPILTFVVLMASNNVGAQQWVTANKDQTRPDPNSNYRSASFSNMNATPFTGYNEIRWTPTNDAGAASYTIEFSSDGLNYRSAGELTHSAGTPAYTIKHYTQSTLPLLYRIRTESTTGKTTYSSNFSVDGIPVAPVKLYPNTITTQTLNVNASWPVLRINIFSLDGNQVFAKDLNGQRDFIPVAIPSLGKGMYLVNFMGDGWAYTQKVLVP